MQQDSEKKKTKKKQSYRYRQQTGGYQWGKEKIEE